MPIMPKKDDGSVDWESGIRTGAYMLDKFEPGVQATFTKNENYYKPGKGWFDAVRVPVDQGLGGAHQRAALRRNPLHGPLRPQDARPC